MNSNLRSGIAIPLLIGAITLGWVIRGPGRVPSPGNRGTSPKVRLISTASGQVLNSFFDGLPASPKYFKVTEKQKPLLERMVRQPSCKPGVVPQKVTRVISDFTKFFGLSTSVYAQYDPCLGCYIAEDPPNVCEPLPSTCGYYYSVHNDPGVLPYWGDKIVDTGCPGAPCYGNTGEVRACYASEWTCE